MNNTANIIRLKETVYKCQNIFNVNGENQEICYYIQKWQSRGVTTAYLRFSKMALTFRTLFGIAEPVPRNSSSG